MNAHQISRGLTAIVVLFAIGCADGQRSGSGANGKGKRMLKTQGPGGRTTPSKTGDKTTSGTTTLPTADDSVKQKTIDDGIAQLNSGTDAFDAKTGERSPAFKDGIYQLVSTSTFFNFPMPSDYLQALKTTDYIPEQNFAATPGPTTPVGLLSTKITQPSRAIGLPLEFTVKAAAQPPLTPANEKVLTSKVNLKVSVVSIDETLAAGTAPAIGLIDLLFSEKDKFDDGKGVTATLGAKILENGDIRFIINVEEALPAPVSSTVYRNFYLTYRLKPTTAAPAANRAMTPAEADAAVAAKR